MCMACMTDRLGCAETCAEQERNLNAIHIGQAVRLAMGEVIATDYSRFMASAHTLQAYLQRWVW